MTFHTLYKYDNFVELLYDNGILSCNCKLLDNRPMHSQTIKLYKGVDNQVKFRVYNPDRRLVNIHGLSVFASLINTENKERVLVKQCDIYEQSPGIFVLSILEGDLINVPNGYYTLSIIGQEEFIPGISNIDGLPVISTPFYTNTSSDIQLYAEVRDSLEKAPIDTIVATEWRKVINTDYTFNYYNAGPFPSNRVKNYRSGVHTIAIYAENFTGKFEVYGTLDQIPSLEDEFSSWFPINLRSMFDYIQFNNFTGIMPYTFQANVLWLKFRWYPDSTIPNNGEISKVMLRS
ncbi:hypothetical protein; structural protein [Pseudomonas phage vB_PaeM_MIJ3]|nr:hypothetical protein GBBBJNDB_00063 [Pseudomonas phage Callisto]WPK39728.1 hypothetical protein ETTORE_0019 [Pseudomonas phage Ettore]VOH53838.1 hypothetical protein; structural protein [Pseudomonas phage vB_PaeM_MIJ3]